MGVPYPGAKTPDPAHLYIGGMKCSTHTIAQFLDELRFLLTNPSVQPRMLLCANAHIYNLAHDNPALRDTINSARVVTADGMSMVWMARFWRMRVAERCNMTEAFRAFYTDTNFPESSGVLIGVTEDEARAAAEAVEAASTHCRISKVYSGYLSEEEYDAIFCELDPVDFIYIGMGTPRTERICQIAASHCPHAVVWGIGAGTIRILAGTMIEAPAVFRRSGFQWLHRFGCEPKLWRRYLVGNPIFVWRMLRSGASNRRRLAQHSAVPRSQSGNS